MAREIDRNSKLGLFIEFFESQGVEFVDEETGEQITIKGGKNDNKTENEH